MKISLAIAALVVAAGSASADVVAYWNFNNSTTNSTSGQLGVLNSVAADVGSGTVGVGNGVTFNTSRLININCNRALSNLQRERNKRRF